MGTESSSPGPAGGATPPPTLPPSTALANLPPTPLSWRLALVVAVVTLTVLAYVADGVLGPRGRALVGIVCFLALTAALSANLRAVNWRTVGTGMALPEAWALVSANPAAAAGLHDRGSLLPGKRGDVVVVDPAGPEILASFAAGRLAHLSAAGAARLG